MDLVTSRNYFPFDFVVLIDKINEMAPPRNQTPDGRTYSRDTTTILKMTLQTMTLLLMTILLTLWVILLITLTMVDFTDSTYYG